jgi:uncharacterized membrane protein YraQ (UPF0718 family)
VLKKRDKNGKNWKAAIRFLAFPAIVLVIYLILLTLMPDETILAFKSCGNILRSLILPLCLVFAVMLLLNLFVKPAQIVRFLGTGAGLKGLLLSIAAGLISAGPIYAWYPLLKDLKEKGAANSLLAIFLYNRAVKPFLLPIMIAYFGWIYVVTLTIFTIIASIAVGYTVGALVKERTGALL